jgi:hypothetical protein
MSETYLLGCNTVPEVSGTEVKFSIKSSEVKQLANWPLRHAQCKTIAPSQTRAQWRTLTEGARYDSYDGLRLGGRDTYFELGLRSTRATGALRRVEEQNVGVASLVINGEYRLSYWNDHDFPFWPSGMMTSVDKTIARMSGGDPSKIRGTDQGDTAGVSFSMVMGNQGFPLDNGWRWQTLNLSLRLATGIPDVSRTHTSGDRTFYSRVEFDGIDRGDIDLNLGFAKRDQQRLTVGLVMNSAKMRELTQGKLVHKNLGIPELPYKGQLEGMIYLKLEGW